LIKQRLSTNLAKPGALNIIWFNLAVSGTLMIIGRVSVPYVTHLRSPKLAKPGAQVYCEPTSITQSSKEAKRIPQASQHSKT
jgi:uncharacterized membrane protein